MMAWYSRAKSSFKRETSCSRLISVVLAPADGKVFFIPRMLRNRGIVGKPPAKKETPPPAHSGLSGPVTSWKRLFPEETARDFYLNNLDLTFGAHDVFTAKDFSEPKQFGRPNTS